MPRSGLSATGYSVVDEVCGDVGSKDYLRRFETPVFRAVVVVSEVAYLLDGSLLWAVDITQPKAPTRISLTRLPGHPLSLAVGSDATLWVASAEGGLLGVDISDPSAPTIRTTTELEADVFDVEWNLGRGYLALGNRGWASFVLDGQGNPVIEHRVAVSSFVADVAIANDKVYAAACSQVVAYSLTEGEPPNRQSSRPVPSGHGRKVTVAGDNVYVSAGEALYAYGTTTDGQLLAIGEYADPAATGFYVNHFVVLGDKGFIAAGDESVRVIELGALAQWKATQQEKSTQTRPNPEDPLDLPIPTARVWSGDPIAVGLHGSSLLVLGNFRWVGERLLTILDASDPLRLPELGRYGQPERYLSIDHNESGNELKVMDSNGRMLLLTPELEIAHRWGFDARQWATVGARLGYVSQDGAFYCAEESAAHMLHGAVSDGLVAVGDRFVVGTRDDNALASFATDDCSASSMEPFAQGLGLISQARLGASNGFLLAYDWVLGILRVFRMGTNEPSLLTQSVNVGLCENYDWADLFSGASESRLRFVKTSSGFALFCPADENRTPSLRNFVWNDAGTLEYSGYLPLPNGTYSDVLATNDGWALATYDNGRYVSELLRLSASGEIIDRHKYDGHAKGVVESGNDLFVLDSDHGPLRYDRQLHELQPVSLPSLDGDPR